MDAWVLAIFAIVYLGMILGGLPRLKLDRSGVALLGAIAMIGLGAWGVWLMWRKRIEDSPWFLRAAVAMGPAGFIAVIAGWIVAEVGRQPWTIYGVLRTADSASPVGVGQISASLLAFMIIYAIVFSAGAVYILRLIARGPAPVVAETPPDGEGRAPGSPLAAAPAEPREV